MQKENCTLSSNCLSVGNYTFDTRHIEGQGATGKVYRGQHSSSGTPVAIKHIDVATLCDDATRTLLRNEIKALRMVSHPNVLHL
jgi:serine/threonine protein kinase